MASRPGGVGGGRSNAGENDAGNLLARGCTIRRDWVQPGSFQLAGGAKQLLLRASFPHQPGRPSSTRCSIGASVVYRDQDHIASMRYVSPWPLDSHLQRLTDTPTTASVTSSAPR